ncbi:MAG: hypothetical protein QOF41_3100 [Methylobacteriaceae bacterium]|nr:hypothetical protein [Methylobacteriaceae bacterium]
MGGGSNFLSRWSRLKRQAGVKHAEAPAAPGGLSGAETSEFTSPSAAQVDAQIAQTNSPALPELTAEELAQLPRIEDLTPETDLTPFLRSGIPAGLRNAALRRMWALDPAIRDSMGDALDYAYDWNIAGGVPGSGPLLPSDDVEAMLRSIMGHPEADISRDAKPEEISGALAGATPSELQTSPDRPLQAAAEPSAPDRTLPEVGTAGGSNPAEVATAAELTSAKGEAAPRSPRHGGATPL